MFGDVQQSITLIVIQRAFGGGEMLVIIEELYPALIALLLHISVHLLGVVYALLKWAIHGEIFGVPEIGWGHDTGEDSDDPIPQHSGLHLFTITLDQGPDDIPFIVPAVLCDPADVAAAVDFAIDPDNHVSLIVSSSKGLFPIAADPIHGMTACMVDGSLGDCFEAP